MRANEIELPQIDVVDESKVESVDVSHQKIDVDDYRSQNLELGEVLNRQSSVKVTHFGAAHEMSSVSIRGSYSDEVVIVLDGIPLNTGSSGGNNLSFLSLNNIQSIDIYKGANPSKLGFPTSGGAVYLNSHQESKDGFSLDLTTGSFGTIKSSGFISHKIGKTRINFGQTIHYTKGNYSFEDDNGTPFNQNDDEVIKRENNQSLLIHPYLNIEHALDDDTLINGVIHYIHHKKGIPGVLSNQAESANLAEKNLMMSFKLSRDHFFHQKLKFENLYYFRWNKSQFEDLEGELGLGGSQDNDDDTKLFGSRVNLGWKLSNYQELSFFSEFQVEEFNPENFNGGLASSKSLRKRFILGVNDQIELFSGKLIFSPSIWYEFVRNNISNADPSFNQLVIMENNQDHHDGSFQLGASYSLSKSISLKSHVNRGLRYPNFSELFGDRGVMIGNPNLEPQKTFNVDFGLYFEKEFKKETSVKAWVEYFYKDIDELIQFVNKGSFIRAENADQAIIKGFETGLNTSFLDRFQINLNYTYQKAEENRGDTKFFLVGRPKHQLGVHLSYKEKVGEISFDVQYQDNYWLDRLNSLRVEDRYLFDLGLKVNLSKKLGLGFSLKNLTNQQTYDAIGFPIPGRAYYVSVNYDDF